MAWINSFLEGVCVCVCDCTREQEQKKAVDTLELELQVPMTHYVGAGDWTPGFWKNST